MEEIRKRHNLSLVILHGSRVGGLVHKKSDIDISIVRKDPKHKLDLFSLIFDLSNKLKTDKIDVSDLTYANPLLLFTATSKGKLLAGDLNDFKKLQRLAFHKHADYQPYFKMEEDFVKERIQNYA